MNKAVFAPKKQRCLRTPIGVPGWEAEVRKLQIKISEMGWGMLLKGKPLGSFTKKWQAHIDTDLEKGHFVHVS